jgi:hypothetical protein
MSIPTFLASEDIITNFKSQALLTKIIKKGKAGWSGYALFTIPALCNIGIVLHEQTTHVRASFWF